MKNLICNLTLKYKTAGHEYSWLFLLNKKIDGRMALRLELLF